MVGKCKNNFNKAIRKAMLDDTNIGVTFILFIVIILMFSF